MRKQIILAIAFLLTGSLAFAAGTSFDAVDADGDGSISKDEFYGSVEDSGIYSDLDADADGQTSEVEFAARGWDYDFSGWDVDGDGYIDADEFGEGAFTEFDKDESGHWDGDEWDDAGDAGCSTSREYFQGNCNCPASAHLAGAGLSTARRGMPLADRRRSSRGS